MEAPVIEVSHLTKQFEAKVRKKGVVFGLKSIFSPEYKKVDAVSNVSFSIKEGELVGFIGPNGAGKSTTLKMLTGILFPTSGKISVLGFNPQKDRVKLAYHLGTIFGQRQQLWHHLPPIDTFNLFSKIYELDQKEYLQRLDELSELFEIKDVMNTPVRKLSLGERMRCEFVGSLLHKPKVLFLDEPTIGMDIIAKKSVREFIRKLNQQEKTTIILTSHDLDDIEELCKRVIVINKGKILYDGSVETIRKRLKYKIVSLYFHETPKHLPKVSHVEIIKQEPFRITLRMDRTKISVREVLDAYLKVCKVDDISVEDLPIEEVIERLYRK